MPCPAWSQPPARVLLALTLIASGPTLGAQQPDSSPPPPPSQSPSESPSEDTTDPTPEQLGAIVGDPEAAPNARLRAALALVSQGSEREPLVVINTLLGGSTGPGSGARVLLRALARRPMAPSELWPPIALLPAGDDPELRVLIARAAGSFRTRDAAAVLVDLAERDPDPSVRAAAVDALVRLSGRELPEAPGAWDNWLQATGAVDGLAWLRGLIEGLSERADALALRAETAESQLVATNRRLHLALPPEQRSALLASLLRDPIPRLRQLGFDLIDRELASSSQLDEDVGLAAIELLSAASPDVRRQAALLVIRLAPAQGAQAVAARLSQETEALVAEELLRGIARWPQPGLEPAVARWASQESRARRSAFNAAWSLHRAGRLSDASAQRDLLDALRALPPEAHETPALRLLVTLGDDTDLSALRERLASENAQVRRRVGEALVPDGGSVDALLDAARRDTSLYDLAAESLMQHRADASGLTALLSLTAPTPAQGELALLALGSLLTIEQLLDATSSATNAALRERLLARVIEAPPSSARTRAIVALAQARLELAQASEALDALNAIDQAEHTPAPEETETRATSLIALGRTEQAIALDASPGAWLRGLELSLGSAHAPSVLEQLTRRFEGSLTPEQAQRLSRLEQAIAEAQTDIQTDAQTDSQTDTTDTPNEDAP